MFGMSNKDRVVQFVRKRFPSFGPSASRSAAFEETSIDRDD